VTDSALRGEPITCLYAQEGQVVDLPNGLSVGDVDVENLGIFTVAPGKGQVRGPGQPPARTELRLYAGWGVGIQALPLMPSAGRPTLTVLVLPKGVDSDDEQGRWSALARFSQLIALGHGAEPRVEPVWGAALGAAERFLLAFSTQLLQAAKEIVARHQRRHYRDEETVFVGRIRGRPLVARHVQLALRGEAHRIPCRFQEFDFDNPDNRLIKSALRRLAAIAAVLAPGGKLTRQLRAAADAFVDVSDDCDVTADLLHARFHRISLPYRNAFAWASLVHRGAEAADGTAGTGAFWLDAPTVFERFVERVAQRAFPDDDVGLQNKRPGVFKGGPGTSRPGARPDLVLSRQGRVFAIGDAKYKDVCETVQASGGCRVPFDTVIAAVSAADTYQLYTYLRLANCGTGFFVVPFWDPKAGPVAVDASFVFHRSPLDGEVGGRAFAFGLNLALSPVDVLLHGEILLRECIGPAES
jgi:hypothetical protein